MGNPGKLLTLVLVDCIPNQKINARNKCYYLVTLSSGNVVLLTKHVDGFAVVSRSTMIGCDAPENTDNKSITKYIESDKFHRALVKALVNIQPSGRYNKASLEATLKINARYTSTLDISYIDNNGEPCNGTLVDAYSSIEDESNVFVISNSVRGFSQTVIKMEGECHIDHRNWKKLYDRSSSKN